MPSFEQDRRAFLVWLHGSMRPIEKPRTPQFRKLQHIVATRPRLALVLRGRDPLLTLAITDNGGTRTLAEVPYDDYNADQAAEDVARALTLDGELPRGMAP